MSFTEAILLMVKACSLGNLVIGRLVVQLLLQKRAVSPEAIEQKARLLNFEHNLITSLHQKELVTLVACGPWNVLVKRFVQEFHEQSFIMCTKISNAQATFGFGSAKVPGCHGPKLWAY
jgi:lipid A disaccharide synthetase